MSRHGKSLAFQARTAIGKQFGRTHATQTTKALMSSLTTIAGFLKERYGLERIENVKPHMIQAFFEKRSADGISASQMAKNATAWRELAAAVGKSNIVPPRNAALGFERGGASRYQPVEGDRDGIAYLRTQLAARAEESGRPADRALVAAFDVRAQFGVRANESIMSRVEERAGNLVLVVEGAKGGRPRELEARTDSQRLALEQHRTTSREIGNRFGRLIPPEMSAKQMYDYQRNTISALGGCKEGKTHMHAQRHGYAQERTADNAGRTQIAEELGHGREEVTQYYVKA